MLRGKQQQQHPQLFVIPKGKHSSKPYLSLDIRRIKKIPTEYLWHFIFTDTCKYNILPDVDQWDWSKLTGISFDLFTNHKYSLMIGWRYNPEKEGIELGYYFHSKETPKFPEAVANTLSKKGKLNNFYSKKPVLVVKPGELVRVSMKLERDKWVISLMKVASLLSDESHPIKEHTLEIPHPKGFKYGCFTREIDPYFGGTSKAPQDISILKRKFKPM